LVEFCLALPPEQKLQQGWTRMILRRAMAGILPEQVQWRGGKADLSPAVDNGLLTNDREILDDVILNGLVSVENYIDLTTLRQFYNQIISLENNLNGKILPVWESVDLALWLRYTGLSPP
jgi:asparagine synthase (glutamine-hydrolysing)